MDLSRARAIMRRGSTTFFNSSLFFPKEVRADVFSLYAFVRTADDYVDRVPQDADGFHAFRDRYRRSIAGERTGDEIVDRFADLARVRSFAPE